MEFKRRQTQQIKVGNVLIGGGAPIAVQSMTKTDTRDTQATVEQIQRLEEAGCELVRVAVPDQEAVESLEKIIPRVNIPVIADIHFDHRLAVESIKKGVSGLRINPGNIGSKQRIQQIVRQAKAGQIPIRIGVNSGSVEREILEKHGQASPKAMVESVLKNIRIVEDMDFHLIKVSIKASDILRTWESLKLLAQEVDYPFHAGITEAGTLYSGSVKSSAGLALILRDGLADTIRISLTAPPELEVRTAFLILSSLGLRKKGLNFISCPVCGRCRVELSPIAQEIEKRIQSVNQPMTVAVMGCEVNGPGEAREADIGMACGKDFGLIFKHGKPLRRVRQEDMVDEFVKEVKKIADSS
ncbi:MAG: flavodoxin-dependent (E)-4-hydroxy-3-methylbut-2-enyl-diphosphate synthase [Candidatus Aminicenantes bacterium]|nr:flavodoxin-dependent (E)-4-hydroxy-3-methylbut-2-enyl-diphosphate synthase [Candidatus Aminicenantes bacterium]